MSTESPWTGDQTEESTAVDDGGSIRSEQPLGPGTSLGRYVLHERLGRGAMGSVYAAHDPLLDRRVALKVLHPERRTEQGTERLLREARALARLSHPNVVTINDFGRSGDLVYLGMELVEGQTLGAWLKAEARDWPEVLRVMLDAGRGLAAAHEAGLVHRDFKPDNVMLARDGRVLLADFGIALAGRESSDPITGDETEEHLVSGKHSKQRAVRLTRTGSLLGTPRYMAPEQFLESEIGPYTDQWAFCAVAWEALVGEHPVPGDTLAELAYSVTAGTLTEPPAEHEVPPRILQALRRGMALDPAERHDSMADLLAQLSPRDERPWSRWAIALGVVAAVSAAVLWSLPSEETAPCDGGARMAEVWNEARAETVAQAFDAAPVPLGAATKQQVIDQLDEYAGGWRDAYSQVCAARATESTERARDDERFACLNDRRQSLDRLLEVFEDADEAVVTHAGEAVLGLQRVDDCLDVDRASDDLLLLPSNPALRHRAQEIVARLGRAQALRKTGNMRRARPEAERAYEQAVSLDYPPLLAQAALELGAAWMGEGERAGEMLGQALELGTSLGKDRLVVWAGLRLVNHHLSLGDVPDALRSFRHAETAAERLGRPGNLELELLSLESAFCGGRFRRRTELAELRPRCEDAPRRALELSIELYGPRSRQAARAHRVMGLFERERGRYERALEHLETARELTAETVGPQHPDVVEILLGMQTTYRLQGDFASAHEVTDVALPLLEAAYGPNHIRFLNALGEQANLLGAEGNYEQAMRYFDRAVEANARVFGPDDLRVSESLAGRGLVLGQLGRYDEALSDLRRALRLAEQGGETPNVVVAVLLDNLGHVLVEGGRPEEAVPLHARAGSMWEMLAPSSPSLAISLTDHGRALLVSRRPREAVPLLERAIGIFDANAGDPAEDARARFLLARTLDVLGDQPARALALGTRARELYARGQGHAEDLAEIDAWLAERTVDPAP